MNGQTPSSFIGTFRYVHDRVTAAGASKLIWIWCPNHSGRDDPEAITASYPGEHYVGWTGVDFYTWGTSQSWSRWTSAVDLLKIRRVAPARPMMIGEMGCSPRGGAKAAWITALWPAVKTFLTSGPNLASAHRRFQSR